MPGKRSREESEDVNGSDKKMKLQSNASILQASRSNQSKKQNVRTGKLHLKGAKLFRMRIICATLSSKAIRIDDIRSSDENPGLRDYEVSFLRLIETISNGCTIKINDTGTSVVYRPGSLIGGEMEHTCPLSRGIGYFVEGLLILSPFCRGPVRCTLTGVTNNNQDLSVDLLRTVTLPLLRRFGVDDSAYVKTTRRGALPDGGGEVSFFCPIVKELKPINFVEEGKVKRVRGVAYTAKCSQQMATTMIDKVRNILNKFIPDVYVYTDHVRGKGSGNSPGYALSLVAESTENVLLSAEYAFEPPSVNDEEAKVPLESNPAAIGAGVAKFLLREIEKGGCVDSMHQHLALLWMVLGPEDVSQIRLGALSAHSIECLRHHC